MYISDIFHQWRSRKRHPNDPDSAATRLPVSVYALGGTSLLTDVSTEMVASILPVYLLVALRLSPAEYGLVDGLFRGGAAVAALLLGGILSYRGGRAKLVAGIGYAMSALTKIGLIASGAFAAIAASLLLDRLGKGLRVAPRDAILAASVRPAQLGLAFGVHRAMDGIGAVAGPLLAALVLWRTPRGYGTVFALSLAAALCGLLVFGCFVRSPAAPGQQVPLRQAARWRDELVQCVPPACRRLLGLAMLLALFTVSEGMVYAHMQRSFALEPYMQPLLPVASASVFLALAVPMGWLADRIGALRLFCGAHLLLLPLYAMLALTGQESDSLLPAAALVVLLGAFVAATDGVLMAAVAGAVPPATRSMSLALFAAGLALMKLASSALFGYLWDRVDIGYAVLIYGIGLTVGLILFLLTNPFRALAALAVPALARE
jgi:MFS family permease